MGDKNTKFFHAIANSRKNLNDIVTLLEEDGSVVQQGQMADYLLHYYKNLMGARSHERRPFDLTGKVGPGFQEELQHLNDQITELEIRETLGGMPKDKSSGPNGFPTEFYQHFWEIIKSDIIAVIRAFQRQGISLAPLNKATITLIPKKPNPTRPTDYRPISVINSIVKIITKLLANRLAPMLDSLIAPNQTAFVKG